MLQGLKLGSEEQDKEQRGQRAGSVQEARMFSASTGEKRSPSCTVSVAFPSTVHQFSQLNTIFISHICKAVSRGLSKSAQGVLSSLSRRICPYPATASHSLKILPHFSKILISLGQVGMLVWFSCSKLRQSSNLPYNY